MLCGVWTHTAESAFVRCLHPVPPVCTGPPWTSASSVCTLTRLHCVHSVVGCYTYIIYILTCITLCFHRPRSVFYAIIVIDLTPFFTARSFQHHSCQDFNLYCNLHTLSVSLFIILLCLQSYCSMLHLLTTPGHNLCLLHSGLKNQIEILMHLSHPGDAAK